MLRVIKIGGSLLDWDDLFQRLPQWIERQPPMLNVWIVGGGKLVDALRDLHEQFGLGERESHWQAVDLLEVTTQVVAKQFPDWRVCKRIEQLRSAIPQQANALFQVGHWLRSRSDVPESWAVTTDSIAALLAIELNATECVLLKSASPAVDQSDSLQSLADEGYVDHYLPSIAVTVRLVNAKSTTFEERTVAM